MSGRRVASVRRSWIQLASRAPPQGGSGDSRRSWWTAHAASKRRRIAWAERRRRRRRSRRARRGLCCCSRSPARGGPVADVPSCLSGGSTSASCSFVWRADRVRVRQGVQYVAASVSGASRRVAASRVEWVVGGFGGANTRTVLVRRRGSVWWWCGRSRSRGSPGRGPAARAGSARRRRRRQPRAGEARRAGTARPGSVGWTATTPATATGDSACAPRKIWDVVGGDDEPYASHNRSN